MPRKPPKRKPGWGAGPRRLAGELLDIRGAAELLGTTELTIRGQIARGRLPYRRLGGRLVCIRGELLDFIRSLPGVNIDEAQANLEARSGGRLELCQLVGLHAPRHTGR